jgi:hypothetical protein
MPSLSRPEAAPAKNESGGRFEGHLPPRPASKDTLSLASQSRLFHRAPLGLLFLTYPGLSKGYRRRMG